LEDDYTHSDSAHGADVILDGFLEHGEASIHVDFLGSVFVRHAELSFSAAVGDGLAALVGHSVHFFEVVRGLPVGVVGDAAALEVGLGNVPGLAHSDELRGLVDGVVFQAFDHFVGDLLADSALVNVDGDGCADLN